jgi:adenylate cyclase
VEPAVVAPDAAIELANRSGEEQVVLIDATGWGADAATAAEVLVLQEFRDLFSREVLAAGRSAGVGTLTILFTDIKGSTALYRSLGDGPAFDRVADHFRLLREAIEPERGSVVKTIGDAVMAAFLEPAGALRAALRAHAALAKGQGTSSLVLKTALHTGPCIAVTLNERLDYFGSTVNVAARLAGLSQGSDIVMSEAVRNDPGVAALLSEAGLTAHGFRAPLRGIEDDAMLWRVRAPT